MSPGNRAPLSFSFFEKTETLQTYLPCCSTKTDSNNTDDDLDTTKRKKPLVEMDGDTS